MTDRNDAPYLGTSIFLYLFLQELESPPPVSQGTVNTLQDPLVVHSQEVEHLVRLGLLEVEVGHHVLEVRHLPQDTAAVAVLFPPGLPGLLPTPVTVVS